MSVAVVVRLEPTSALPVAAAHPTRSRAPMEDAQPRVTVVVALGNLARVAVNLEQTNAPQAAAANQCRAPMDSALAIALVALGSSKAAMAALLEQICAQHSAAASRYLAAMATVVVLAVAAE